MGILHRWAQGWRDAETRYRPGEPCVEFPQKMTACSAAADDDGKVVCHRKKTAVQSIDDGRTVDGLVAAGFWALAQGSAAAVGEFDAAS